MANNYLQFSEVLTNLTAEEETWLNEQLETIYVFGDRQYTEEQLPEELDSANADWSGVRAWYDVENQPVFPENHGFCYQFNNDIEWGRHLWFYAEEFGDPELVACLVQKFLKRFRPGDCWSLSYAYTCAKPRVHEFGGGAVFVMTDEIQFFASDGFILDHRMVYDQRDVATRLALWATNNTIVYELDDLVISLHEEAAAAVNNGGQRDQFLYLLQSMSEQSIRQSLRKA